MIYQDAHPSSETPGSFQRTLAQGSCEAGWDGCLSIVQHTGQGVRLPSTSMLCARTPTVIVPLKSMHATITTRLPHMSVSMSCMSWHALMPWHARKPLGRALTLLYSSQFLVVAHWLALTTIQHALKAMKCCIAW